MSSSKEAHCECHHTLARPAGDRLIFGQVELAGEVVSVELLLPFSWDAEDRGVTAWRRTLTVGQTVVAHSGGYGTADAVAALKGRDFSFPDERDGHRYVVDAEPGPDDLHQDAAGWVVVQVDHQVQVLAWDYAGAVTTTIEHTPLGAQITLALPGLIAETEIPGPDLYSVRVDGDLDAGVAALKELLTELVDEPDLSGMPTPVAFPPVVVNSWGCGEDTSTERVLALMDASQRIGAEVFVVDKGWERAVGDWYPNERFAPGLAALSQAARERGMGFGIWCGFGNADPQSPVAQRHPDWLSHWQGRPQRLSFDNLGLCLGHHPVEQWVEAELHRMVIDFELTWLIHDFESISRCDRADHTHPATGGEWAAAQAWSRILASLKQAHPQLVLENCWNGVRPLDIAMVKGHHTTITEDHCTSRWNIIAKHGLGRYLPLDWQSAYMGAEDLPDRARIAPYVIGGPWIIMEDAAAWSPATVEFAAIAVERYKQWRSDWRRGTITLTQGDITELEAIGTSRTRYRMVQVPAGLDQVTLDLGRSCRVIDGWTGTQIAARTTTVTLPVAPDGDGLLLQLDPMEDL